MTSVPENGQAWNGSAMPDVCVCVCVCVGYGCKSQFTTAMSDCGGTGENPFNGVLCCSSKDHGVYRRGCTDTREEGGVGSALVVSLLRTVATVSFVWTNLSLVGPT